MQSITTLNLNLQYPNFTTTMYAVQHDRLSRKITAMLFDGSVPFEPEYGTLAVVRYKKPDGTCGFYDTDEDGNTAVTWDGNTATIMLAEQALTVAGTVLCQVQFYNSGEQRLSSFTWKINVEENACTDDTITSSDYFNVLTQQIAAILDVISDIPAPATILPLMDGTAAIGTRGEFARSDHVHPTDTSITNKIGNTPLTTTAQTLTGGINEVNLSGGLDRGNLPSTVTTINGLMNLDAGVYRCGNVSTTVFPHSYGELQIIKGGAYGVALFYPVNNTSGAAVYRRSWNITTSSMYESDWVGMTGIIPIEQGGTGATSASAARTALGLGSVATESTVPVTKGGTGATSASAARTNLGLGSVATESTVPVTKGGTGATSASAARTNLGLGSLAVEDFATVAKGGTGATSASAARTNLGLSYAVNDTMSITSYSFVVAGVINSAATTIYLDCVTDKSMENISSVSVTAMTGSMNGIYGLLDASSSINFAGSGYSLVATKLSNFHVRVAVTKSGGSFSNTSGNAPVTYFGTLALKFT